VKIVSAPTTKRTMDVAKNGSGYVSGWLHPIIHISIMREMKIIIITGISERIFPVIIILTPTTKSNNASRT